MGLDDYSQINILMVNISELFQMNNTYNLQVFYINGCAAGSGPKNGSPSVLAECLNEVVSERGRKCIAATNSGAT